MKISLLFIGLLTFFFIEKSGDDKLIIIPGKGVGNIEIGKSTIDDVIEEYGKVKVKRKWHKAVEVELFGRFEYYLQYDSLATFSTFTKNRNKKVIYKIVLSSGSKCKTANGIGVGSSYKDLKKELGRPEQFYFQGTKYNREMVVFYDNMMIIMNGSDSTKNVVSKITIW